jgi:hypothetical protein
LTLADNTHAFLDITNPTSGAYVGFYGFVSDTVINSILIESPGTQQEEFALNNAYLPGTGGTVGGGGTGGTTVPEPSSVLLLAAGLVGIGGLRRRLNVQK